MRGEVQVEERVLVDAEDEGESRRIVLIEGEDLALLERTQGPVTQVAYGASEHTHKMLFGREECARVLGVQEGQAAEALVAWFGEAEELCLSDVMDRFDVAGAHYAYLAWSNEGDVALRKGR